MNAVFRAAVALCVLRLSVDLPAPSSLEGTHRVRSYTRPLPDFCPRNSRMNTKAPADYFTGANGGKAGGIVSVASAASCEMSLRVLREVAFMRHIFCVFSVFRGPKLF